jgi:hypothetical protein
VAGLVEVEARDRLFLPVSILSDNFQIFVVSGASEGRMKGRLW